MPSPENDLGSCIDRQRVGCAQLRIDALHAAGSSMTV
jgi:hypothetical protein